MWSQGISVKCNLNRSLNIENNHSHHPIPTSGPYFSLHTFLLWSHWLIIVGFGLHVATLFWMYLVQFWRWCCPGHFPISIFSIVTSPPTGLHTWPFYLHMSTSHQLTGNNGSPRLCIFSLSIIEQQIVMYDCLSLLQKLVTWKDHTLLKHMCNDYSSRLCIVLQTIHSIKM